MDEACSVCFERQMTSSSYLPNVVDTNRDAIEEALATDTQAHGYGASMFMTYMVGKQGVAFLGDVIRRRQESYDPIGAFNAATSSLIGVDWGLFGESFMKTTLYGSANYPSAAIIDSFQRGTFAFDSPFITGTTFTWSNAPHLSVRVFRVTFASIASWNDTDELGITFSGADPNSAPSDASYIICKYMNTALTFVASSNEHEYAVKQMKQLIDANGAVYIMVVNKSLASPYNGARTDTINLKVERREDFLERLHKNDCISIRNQAQDVYHDSLGGTWPVQLSAGGGFNTLHWSGTSFNTDHQVFTTAVLYASGSVDLDARTVTLTYTYHDQSATDGSYTDITYTYTDLPIANSIIQYPWVDGFAAGAAATAYVTDISYTGFRDMADPDPDYSFWFDNFTWSDGPAGDVIEVSFKTGL
jgi:hypothetical protein